MPSPSQVEQPIAGLTRQFAAMIYDSFLILAILFVVMGIAVALNSNSVINPTPAFFMSLSIIYLFYTWFWTKSGQTLGMVIWKIKLVSEFGGSPGWQICLLRLIFSTISLAFFGLGYWVRLFKPYTLPDLLSQTRIIRLNDTKKKNEE